MFILKHVCVTLGLCKRMWDLNAKTKAEKIGTDFCYDAAWRK